MGGDGTAVVLAFVDEPNVFGRFWFGFARLMNAAEGASGDDSGIPGDILEYFCNFPATVSSSCHDNRKTWPNSYEESCELRNVIVVNSIVGGDQEGRGRDRR